MRLKLAVCFLAAAASAIAADRPAAARLPDPVAMVVSTPSPTRFLESLDEYLSAALAETPVGYQPGLLPLLAGMFSPPPLAAADLDAEMHLILLSGGGSFGERGAILASVGDYRRYLDAAAGGGTVTEEENGVAAVATPEGVGFYAADGGEGKALVATSRSALLDALEAVKSWRPAVGADGALEVALSSLSAIDPEGNLLSRIEEMAGELAPFGDEAADSFAERGFDGEVARGFFRTMKMGVEWFGRELAGLAGGKVELAPAGDNLSIRFFLTPGDGGFIGDVAGHASALSNTVYPTARAGDSSILCVSQIAPVQAIIPGHLAFFRDVASAVLKETMPSLEEEVARGIGRFFDGGPGETVRFVVAHDMIIDRIRADDPEIVFEALTDGFRSFDKALELAAGGQAGKRARIVIGDETVDGTDVRRIRLVFDEGSVWKLDPEDSDDDALRAVIRKMEDLHYVMTRTGEHVVIAATERSAGDAVRAIAGLAAAAAPMVETPKAKAVLDAMRRRQIGFALLNPQSFIRLAIENIIVTESLSEGAASMLEGVLDDLAASDELFGLGYGVGPDGCAFEALFTAAGVNDMVKNYYLIASRLEAMSGSGEDPEEDMDGGLDPDGNGEDEDADAREKE